jgi:hypothetical protein
MKEIMENTQVHKKGPHLNTLEIFHTHKEITENNHLNDPQTILPNAIFTTLLKTRRTDQ